jgi:hypothetical protein
LATREGWGWRHVQAVTVAIDQWAEVARGTERSAFRAGWPFTELDFAP